MNEIIECYHLKYKNEVFNLINSVYISEGGLDEKEKSELFNILNCEDKDDEYFLIKNTDNEIVSFGGFSRAKFQEGVFELRWGTTREDYRFRGLMTEITNYRINRIIDIVKQSEYNSGLIIVGARKPNMFKKLGFKNIWKRCDGAETLILQIENEVLHEN